MMLAISEWLVNNEPFISAAVGIFTLLALAWGLISVIYRGPVGTSLLQAEGVTRRAGPLRNLMAPVLDLGVEHHLQAEDRIAARTVNVATTILLLLSAGFIVFAFVSPAARPLAMFHGFTILVCLAIFRLQAAGDLGRARWLLLLVAVLDWCTAQVLVGAWRGNEYVLAVLCLIPILVFRNDETRYRMIAWLLMAGAASITIGATILNLLPPLELSASMHILGYHLTLVTMTLMIFLLVNFYVNFSVASFSELELEKDRTEELVTAIFPAGALDGIAANGQPAAVSHEEATVVFITVSGFESLYGRISAVQLVELMSEIFLKFDELLQRHEVEKINTLGTHYVAASGVFNSGAPDHLAVADFVLDARRAVDDFSARLNHRFSLRAGISTGQVISGVIGSTRPCFDIWGTTVELANTMRDTALENSIVVNEPTFWRLRDEFEFAEIPGATGSYLLLRALSR